MYNSIIVRSVAGLLKSGSNACRGSVFLLAMRRISGAFSKVSRHSTISRLVYRDYEIMRSSFLYKILNAIYRFVMRIIKYLSNPIRRIVSGGVISEASKSELGTFENTMRAFYLTLIGFGVALQFVRLVFSFSHFKLRNSILLMAMGFIGLLFNGAESDIVNGSYLFNYFRDFFELDKGGEHWW